jgi:starch synthase
MALTGLDWRYFNWRQMEFYGNLSFLKTAIVFSDAITTVSPTYAKEILHPPLSCGFEGVLNHRARDLTGIINGVDYDVWNPATDRLLGDFRYSLHNYAEGKAACKRELQRSLHLPQRAETPLIAAIGRLADQKGFDLITRVMQHWAERVDAQWVILGTGEPKYHEMLSSLGREFPDRVAVRLEFSDELAHRIEAAADIFVMPSQYEPCGLNQLYSLKYGTVPVVRATGGLVDTVVSATDEAIANGTATGFSFDDYTSLALSEALEKACRTYLEKPLWRQLIETGMQQDWSWRTSAEQYARVYEQTVQRGPLPIS